jgi:hypothetical protein
LKKHLPLGFTQLMGHFRTVLRGGYEFAEVSKFEKQDASSKMIDVL